MQMRSSDCRLETWPGSFFHSTFTLESMEKRMWTKFKASLIWQRMNHHHHKVKSPCRSYTWESVIENFLPSSAKVALYVVRIFSLTYQMNRGFWTSRLQNSFHPIETDKNEKHIPAQKLSWIPLNVHCGALCCLWSIVPQSMGLHEYIQWFAMQPLTSLKRSIMGKTTHSNGPSHIDEMFCVREDNTTIGCKGVEWNDNGRNKRILLLNGLDWLKEKVSVIMIYAPLNPEVQWRMHIQLLEHQHVLRNISWHKFREWNSKIFKWYSLRKLHKEMKQDLAQWRINSKQRKTRDCAQGIADSQNHTLRY